MTEQAPIPDDPHEIARQKFAELFGITEDELVRQGIDPGDYARENVGKALKDRRNWNLVLPKSKQLSILWTRWGWRAFVGMFIGLGFLGLSDIRALHWVGVAGAICSALLVVIMFVMSWKFHSRYVRARREEGADPSI